MSGTDLEFVTVLDLNQPSVVNLRQSLEYLGYETTYRSLTFDVPMMSGIGRYVKAASVYVSSLYTYLLLNSTADALIVHKSLSQVDTGTLEKLFSRFDTVIYSSYDANHVNFPQSTAVIADRADAILAISEQLVDNYEALSSNVHYVPPSVDCDFFEPIASPVSKHVQEFDTIDMVVGWVGDGFVHRHNLQILLEGIRAASETHRIGVRILAGGGIPDSIRQALHDSSAEVDVIDWVPRSAIPTIVNTFDVGTAPLVDTEYNRCRSSEKVREYMACGVPVIASDVGENPVLVPDSVGELVSTPVDWGQTLDALVNAPDRVVRMGDAARSHAVENYAIPVIADAVESVIRDCLDRK